MPKKKIEEMKNNPDTAEMDAPKPVYNDLLKLVQNKDYFVITMMQILEPH